LRDFEMQTLCWRRYDFWATGIHGAFRAIGWDHRRIV
jgi:hypothetical protein